MFYANRGVHPTPEGYLLGETVHLPKIGMCRTFREDITLIGFQLPVKMCSHEVDALQKRAAQTCLVTSTTSCHQGVNLVPLTAAWDIIVKV